MKGQRPDNWAPFGDTARLSSALTRKRLKASRLLNEYQLVNQEITELEVQLNERRLSNG